MTFTAALVAVVILAFRAGRIVGLGASILGVLIIAVAIALFGLCTALTF